VTNTFWEAVKAALWDFQFPVVDVNEFEDSDDTPGAREKLDVLTERIRRDAARWSPDDGFANCYFSDSPVGRNQSDCQYRRSRS